MCAIGARLLSPFPIWMLPSSPGSTLISSPNFPTTLFTPSAPQLSGVQKATAKLIEGLEIGVQGSRVSVGGVADLIEREGARALPLPARMHLHCWSSSAPLL